jgi:formate hydrogenlyase transcriptional activator
MNAASQALSISLSADRYEALLRVSQTIAAHRDSQELFRTIAGELRQVVAFDFLSVVLYEEKTHTLKLCVVETPACDADTQPRDISPEETVSWWVYQHQEPIVIPRLDQETRFPKFTKFLRDFGMQSICALPLTTVHRRLGTLGFGSIRPAAYSEAGLDGSGKRGCAFGKPFFPRSKRRRTRW